MSTPATPEYLKPILHHWEAVDVYRGPGLFLITYATVPLRAGQLIAAHWGQSEVRNGGFFQFFMNPTGVLAPEAFHGFEAMGRTDLARLVRSAMDFFKGPYPREDHARRTALVQSIKKSREEEDPFYETDQAFYACLSQEPFEVSAARFAARLNLG